MIEVGKRYKLRASRREIEIVSMSKSGRHATIKMLGDSKPQEIQLSTSDVETSIYNDQQAAPPEVTTADGITPYPGFPFSPLEVLPDKLDWIVYRYLVGSR